MDEMAPFRPKSAKLSIPVFPFKQIREPPKSELSYNKIA